MDIAKEALRGDTTLELSGLRVFIEERANTMLENTNIDFNDKQGFILSGMQSSCGSSCSSC
jgi:Fe-S cluster assembly iron-binding protein IscA